MRLQSYQFCLKLLRLSLYKLTSFVRQCRNTIAQMSWITSLQNSYASLSRSRKILLGFIILAVIFLYIWPSWLPFQGTKIQIDPTNLCIDAKLQKHRRDIEHYDVIVNRAMHEQDFESSYFWPFVGNGYIGFSPSSKERLHIKHGRALAVQVPFYPSAQVSIEGYSFTEATLLHLREGSVEKLQCFETGPTCVSVSTKTYAHRTRPSTLVQQIRVTNPTNNPITISIEQIGLSDWQDVQTSLKTSVNSKQEEVQYAQSVGTVPLPDANGLHFVVGVANSKIPDTITVQSGQTWSHQTLTAVRYTELPMSKKAASDEIEKITELVQQSFTRSLNINSKILNDEHTNEWDNQWNSGFGISNSKAPGAINGDRINTTLYYAMSNAPSPIHEVDRSAEQKYSLEKLLYFPDRCYSGHHTLQNDKMWTTVDSTSALIERVKTWVITLEKNGCATMLQAGSDGLLQAMILSFGAFHFANDHLEFGTEPKDLHRDYFFRRINYGNNTHVNISVIVGDDNKAVMYAGLDRNDKPYYACDAGCLDAPVKLSKENVQFPVKLTQPLTAIMYITADKLHMEELKHAIHVREIAIAPAHEHHVIALHKHGHHLGGLPMMFWISISLLIIIFHLFLFKLIFNEYCQANMDRYSRTSKYNI